MSTLLEQLAKDTLPRTMLHDFVLWCIWEQARPALITILERTEQDNIAQRFRSASDLATLKMLGKDAAASIKRAQRPVGPIALSAAKAAAFEYRNLLNCADELDYDPEAAAFFAARVCGWAGWAETNFTQTTRKPQTEHLARQQQEAHLQKLWQQYASAPL